MADNEVKMLKKKISNPEVTKHFRLLRAISGSSRLKILYLLSQVSNPGLTITDISKILNASLSRISHQMRILKKSGLVNAEKQGRNVIYTPVLAKVSRFVTLPK
jgi:ArsR family transcriptional regulator